MDMSAKGRHYLKIREGVRAKAYPDGGGVWTIGVGHTAMAGPPKPRRGMILSDIEIDELLAHDLVKYEDAVERALKGIKLKQHEFDALVSLCFNIGERNFAKSSVVKYIRAGDKKTAADKFLLWNKDNGKTILGLVIRRKSERLQFLGQLE